MAAADYLYSPQPNDSVEHVPLSLLRQYAVGALSAHEQHQVERHTLDCERCADILAGLLRSDATITDAGVNRLRARLQQHIAKETEPTESVPMWPWRHLVAASLVLVIGMVAFFWLKSANPNITQVPVAAVVSPSAVSEADEIQVTQPTKVITQVPLAAAPSRALAKAPLKRRVATAPGGNQSVEEKQSGQPVPVLASSSVATLTVPSTTPSLITGDSLPSKMPNKANPETPHYAAAFAAHSLATRRSIQPDSSDQAGIRLVRGRIVDQLSGQGISGVVVQVQGRRVGIATDSDGSFAVQVLPQTSSLTITASGYATRKLPIATNSDTTALTIALTPSAVSLNESVLVRREKTPTPLAVAPVPAGGYPAFNEYLKKELEYPEKALAAHIEGTVRLSFIISPEGAIQDIKVLRKVSPEIDEEAVRLLQEGPKWFPAIRNGRRVAQVVDLKIPFVLAENR